MKSQDQIDRLVRERLLESNQSGSDWDLPSEKVWVEVKQRIQEKRRWRGAIWWAFGGMIVVVSAVLFLFLSKKPDPIAVQSITNVTSPSMEIKNADPAIQGGEARRGENGVNRAKEESGGYPEVGQPLAENGGSKEKRGNGGQTVADQTVVENAAKTEATITTVPISSSHSSGTHSKTIPVLNFENSSQAQRQNSTESWTTGSSEMISESAINPIFPSVAQTSRPLLYIAFLQSVIGIQQSFDRVLPEIQKLPVMIPVMKHSAWSLAFVTTPALGTRRINVPIAQPRVRRNLLLDQEEPAVQLGFGISATRALSPNWSIVGGAEYGRFLLNSSTTHQIRYSRIEERLNSNGNFENRYRLNLNTSYGEVSTDVIVERSSDSQMSEHQFINLSLQTRQAMQVLEFPVSLKYTLPLDRLSFSCYGGLSANVLLENSLEFRGVRSQSNGILQTRVAKNAPLSGFRNFALGYQFGVGLEIPLQRQWSLVAGPSVSGYLQPVYENRHVVIYPITFDLQFGVRYQL